jgi:hypothetical protein
MPPFLIENILSRATTDPLEGPQTAQGVVVSELDTTTPPRYKDAIIEKTILFGSTSYMKKVKAYFRGFRKEKIQSKSEDDFALMCALAFLCGYHMPQMIRLFMLSGLYRPDKGAAYLVRTAREAIKVTPHIWIRKPRKSRATGADLGRKLSPITLAILELHLHEPDLSSKQLSIRLEVTTRQVRDAVRYHAAWKLVEIIGTLVHSSTHTVLLEPSSHLLAA